jgi:hypothetical protein
MLNKAEECAIFVGIPQVEDVPSARTEVAVQEFYVLCHEPDHVGSASTVKRGSEPP